MAEGFVRANGLDIHYESHGRGMPLVLLHGSLDCTLAMWRNQAPVWARRFRVLVPDLRGHGRTRHPGGPITLATLADDAAAFSRALKLDRPVLIGISMGGMAALEAGLRHPAAFRGLVAGCSSLHRPFPGPFRRRIRAIGMLGPDRVEPDRLERSDPARAARLAASHPLYPDQWKDLMRNLSAMFWTTPLRGKADYRRLRKPVLAVIGDRDESFRLEGVVEMYRCLPDGELAVLPGHGHTSFFSGPETPFAALVEAFLDKRWPAG